MSNFLFVNDQAFLSYPSCKKLYDYAMQVENNYYADHMKTALYARFFLEQFCIFVSEVKNAKYPGKRVMMGDYWSNDNFFEFLRVFGKGNIDIIKELNQMSCSYVHSCLEDREDLYPKVVQQIYALLLWLYKDLGLKTSMTYADYSVDKIPEFNSALVFPGGIYFSTEQMRGKLKKFFPNSNTADEYRIEKSGDRYIIRDKKNQIIDTLILPTYEKVSDETVLKMQENLEEKAKEIEALRAKSLTEKKKYEEQIEALKDELAASVMKGNSSIDLLKNQLAQLEEKSLQREKQYKDAIVDLQKEYSSLYEKNEHLMSEQQKREELQQEIRKLVKERKDLQQEFSVTQDKLLAEIEYMQNKLSGTKDALVKVNASVSERDVIIMQLQNELREKEILLMNIQNEAVLMFDKLQGETNELTKKYDFKVSNLEILLTEIKEENQRYKEYLNEINRNQEVKHSLRIVKCGIMRLDEGYHLYRVNASEQKLRELLLQVKNYYESQINELKEKLDEKEQELDEIKKRKEKVVENIPKDNPTVDKTPRQHSSFNKTALIFLLLAIVLFGYSAFLLGKLNSNSNESGENSVSDKQEIGASQPPQSGNTEFLLPVETESDTSSEKQPSMPEETEVAIATGTELPVASETELPEPSETEITSEEMADTTVVAEEDIWEEIRDERVIVPDSVFTIPNVNQEMLNELLSINTNDIRSIVLNQNTTKESEYYLGTVKVPSIAAGKFHSVTDAALYRNEEHKFVKFAYDASNSYFIVVYAVAVDALCSDIGYDSTVEDIKKILGDNYYIGYPSIPTRFETSTAEKCYTFYLTDGDSINFRFDEDGKICDYIYFNAEIPDEYKQ